MKERGKEEGDGRHLTSSPSLALSCGRLGERAKCPPPTFLSPPPPLPQLAAEGLVGQAEDLAKCSAEAC